MTKDRAEGLNWTAKTVAFSIVMSLAGLIGALALKRLGVWPPIDYSEYLFGGLCGATTVHRLHPARPTIVLMVFVPVMSVLLLMATVVFYRLILRAPIEF